MTGIVDQPIRGDLYWANLEPVKGSEQGGSRPVLIMSNNIMNRTAPIIVAIPMTRAEEKISAGPFNIPFKISTAEIIEENVKNLL